MNKENKKKPTRLQTHPAPLCQKEEEKYYCDACQDTGYIEIMGGSSGFEWDVVDVVLCECQKDY